VMREMIYVKICGITNPEDAMVAVEAGADLIGFVFYSKSPRYVEPECAHEIVAALRERGRASKFVGVFVNDSLERMRAVMQVAQLDFVQLHGDEPAEMVRALSPRAYKALRPRDAAEARAEIETYRAVVDGGAPAFIVDAFDAHQFGGTGARGDWDIAADIAREFPILLAGGLNAENVADAIRAVAPWGVDVSSGVERAAGLKDHAKVWQFIQQVRQASSR